MDSTQVGMIIQTHQVVFGGLPQCLDGAKPGSSGHMTYAPGKFCTPGVEKVACGWGVQNSADTYISYRGSLFPASTSGVSLFHPSCILCGGLPIYSGPDVAHLPLDFNDAGPVSTVIMTFCLVGEDLRNLPAISNLFSCLSLLANSSGNGGVLSQGVLSWVTLLLPTLNNQFHLAIWNEAATIQHL